MSDDKVTKIYTAGTKNYDITAWYYTITKDQQKDLKLVRMLEKHPDGGPFTRDPDHAFDLQAGYPISGEHLPKTLRKNGPRSKKRFVSDFEQMYGMALVSEKFKQLTEALEPGVHQFFPVDIVWHGKPVEGNFYWFIVCNALDSISPEHTKAARWEGYSPVFKKHVKGFWAPDKERGRLFEIVHELSKVQGKHIWREEYHPGSPFHKCSDVFKKHCEEQQLTGITFLKRETV